ncbi:MAG TPA: D-sedoheptulose 7-phosphate isomerase [Ktedonobacteraceae bacterium]|nr:D-sedoheptulose 7-phosphate isomerase [Ktedonobacteraceae bacterium]
MMKQTLNGQNTTEQYAIAELLEGSNVIRQTAFCLSSEIVNVAEHIIAALQQGYKVMSCGNGGSAADAQHFAAELVGRYRRQRPSWAAIALTVDSSVLTSLSNDYGFEQVFARQVQALGRPGDILVAISTSGSSKNVLAAVEMASSLGIRTVGLTGEGKSRLGEMVDHHLPVPSANTAFIQQAHIAILHVFCELVEARLTGESMNSRLNADEREGR